MHLDSATDRDCFRRWFTFLAESQYYSAAPAREITDCAALVRWCFRQAISRHDSAWANSLGLSFLPAIPEFRRFAWPRTPVGAALFQTGPASFGQFADAETLRRFNTRFLSRDIEQARPGDLLFYKQFERAMPAHVMIYIGASRFETSPQRWVVYDTGPSGGRTGEIRKVSTVDLRRHPAPEWRPVPGNSNFLGVWRLDLLCDLP